MPASYTLGKTLSADQSENVFEFVYERLSRQTQAPVNPVAPGGNAAGTNPAAAGAGAGNNANTANIGDNDVPMADRPAQYTDLDENATPQAAPSQDGILSHWPLILAGIAALILIALIILWLIRRHMRNQDDTV